MNGTNRLGSSESVGHYRIENRLGVGELGMVYRAWDEHLERWVTMRQAVIDDLLELERFRRGARAIAGLSHPSLVRIYDFVEAEDGDWIVMEFIEGQTLRALLDEGALDPVQAVPLAREITEGMAVAHDRDIVFLSLQSDSVLVSDDGHAKILDIGLARLLHRDKDDPLRETIATPGAIRTLSPEQAMGHVVDHRSDLFSLGSLLYEMVTGRAPFVGSSYVQTLQRLCSRRQESANRVNDQVSAELSALIDRLLEKEPENRLQTAAEVVSALSGIEAGKGPMPGTQSIKLSELTDPGPHRGDSKAGSTETQIVSLKTLLVTDLVGSTRLVEDLGDRRAADVLAHHDRLARDLMTEFQGREIDKTDGFLILFKRPVDAVEFAFKYHLELERVSAEADIELKARVGIHLGEVILHETPLQDILRGAKPIEVQGLAKPIAARAMSLAGGGQTLLTRAAFDLSRRAMKEEHVDGRPVHWMSHGEYRFKGVEDRLQIFEAGLEGNAPLAPPADREKARRVVDESVQPKSSRWTLPGLLRGIAALVLIALLIKVFVLPTGRQSLSAETRPAIAVLGFKNLSGRPELAWLSTALSELFSTELATGGQLRLIPGESIAHMKLELAPPDVETLGADTLDAIARNLGTDYVLLGSYLPVGVEENSEFRLLLRLQDTREESKIVALSDSGTEAELFELVSRTGKILRQRLGIAELSDEQKEAVRALLSASPEANKLYSEGLEELRGFDALAARDLLQQAVELEPRFALAHAALSEAWRDLGHDKQAEVSARKAFEEAQGLPRAESLAIEGRYWQASGEWDRASAAYRMLWELSPGNIDYGVQLAEAEVSAGRPRDALSTLEALRTLPAPASDDPRIDLAEASASGALSNYPAQLAAAERALTKGREHEAWILVAEAQRRQWRALRSVGRAAEARKALEEARQLLAEAGDQSRLAEVLGGLAVLLEDEGKRSEAEALYRQTLQIHRQTGNRKGVAQMQNNLADLVLDRGELEAAIAMVDEAVAAVRDIGDREMEASFLDTRVWVLIHKGGYTEADETALEGMALYREIGSREGIAWAHFYRGKIAFATGDLTRAVEQYAQAAEIANQIGNKSLLGFVLSGQGQVLLATGALGTARERFDQAVELRSQLGDPAELAETQLPWIRLLLETKRTAEAESLASRTVEELRSGESTDYQAAAAALLARVRVAQGQLDGAREALDAVRDHAARSQNPMVRLSVELAEANLLAARRETSAALGKLASIDAESAELGLLGLGFEARLDRAAVEIAAGGQAAADGRARLEALVPEATDKGFTLIAQRAAARL
ncbi:MAG: protein kinase [bacterium]|nr:protein kinase [bacterium]